MRLLFTCLSTVHRAILLLCVCLYEKTPYVKWFEKTKKTLWKQFCIVSPHDKCGEAVVNSGLLIEMAIKGRALILSWNLENDLVWLCDQFANFQLLYSD